MEDIFENMSSFTKFMIMLVIYTAYLSWWASGVNSALNVNTNSINRAEDLISDHIAADYQITIETVKLGENLKELTETVHKHDIVIQSTIEQHAKCAQLMDELFRKIERNERTKER